MVLSKPVDGRKCNVYSWCVLSGGGQGGEGGDGHNCVNVRLEKFYKSDFLFYKTK